MKKKKFRIKKKVLIIIFLIIIGSLVVFLKPMIKFKEDTKVNDKIDVIDKEKPIITYQNTLTTKVGVVIDLLENVKVSDNSSENIEIKVEGEYDFNKVGEYNLFYVAIDASGNETREEFILKVIKNSSSTNNQNLETSFTTSKGFKGVVKDGATYIDGYLIVNKTYALPSNYGTKLTDETMDSFNKMKSAALLDGLNIYIASGFRSYQKQVTLYDNYVKRDGKLSADTYSARAGHSEHQTGLTFDVNTVSDAFIGTKEAVWLEKNCYKYGFILRFPKGKDSETGFKYEAWHFRYVGTELAEKLYNNGDWLTLESYFGITSEYSS